MALARGRLLLRFSQLLDQTVTKPDYITLDLVDFRFDLAGVKVDRAIELFNDLPAMAGEGKCIVFRMGHKTIWAR